MKTAILIDSGCDVSHELIQRFHMKVMHLHIIYPERDYVDGVDILPETIYQRFSGRNSRHFNPSPQDVKDMAEEIKAEGYTHVLAFCISSGLSLVHIIRWEASGDEKELTSLCSGHTRSISFEPVYWLYGQRCSWKKAEVLDELKEMLPKGGGDSKVFYYMDTLTYLQKRGEAELVWSPPW